MSGTSLPRAEAQGGGMQGWVLGWGGGVRDPWVLGGVGGFLRLLGPFVIKEKPNQCLGSSLGRPLALPPQPQLLPGGSS